MALNEDTVMQAIATIKTVESELTSFRGEQKAINETQAKTNKELESSIRTLELSDVETRGEIKAVQKDTARILVILEKKTPEFRQWVGTLTPYILIIGGLFVFYVSGGKITP
jgi:ribosomal protein L29